MLMCLLCWVYRPPYTSLNLQNILFAPWKTFIRASLVAQWKDPSCQCRRCRVDPWVRNIPRRRKGNPLQYSCLEKPMDRAPWHAAVHGGSQKGQAWLTTKQQPQNKHRCSFTVLLLIKYYYLPYISYFWNTLLVVIIREQPWGFPGGTSGKEPAFQYRRPKRLGRSLSQKDPLEEGMAFHSIILAWRIPRTEKPGGLQSIVLQSQDWSELA